jgi:hypothetical protein
MRIRLEIIELKTWQVAIEVGIETFWVPSGVANSYKWVKTNIFV